MFAAKDELRGKLREASAMMVEMDAALREYVTRRASRSGSFALSGDYRVTYEDDSEPGDLRAARLFPRQLKGILAFRRLFRSDEAGLSAHSFSISTHFPWEVSHDSTSG